MIPSEVSTILIGTPPPIVDYCFEQNLRLCNQYDIPFVVHCRERNYLYRTPGIQAEAEKIQLHTCFSNTMVIDWDIELLAFPDLPKSSFPYLGRTTDGRNDLFLSWCNSIQCQCIIDIWRNSLIDGKNGIDFTNYTRPFTVEFPEEYYIHYRTLCGYSITTDTFGDLPIEKQRHLMRVSKQIFTSTGKLWPI
jgi:hypothetical protein